MEKDWDFLDNNKRTLPLTYKYNPDKLGSYSTDGPPQGLNPVRNSVGGLMSSPPPVTSQNGTSFSGGLGSFLKPIINKGVGLIKDKLTATPPSTNLPDVPKLTDSFYGDPNINLPLRPATGIGDVFNPGTWAGRDPFGGLLPEYRSEAFNPGNYEGTFYNGEFGNIDTGQYDQINYQQPSQGYNLMDKIGKGMGMLNIGKGIYGLMQGSGGKGGVDLATGIGSQLIPGFGAVKGIFDAVMGIGSYVKGRGRQYDHWRPYAIDSIVDKNGIPITKFGYQNALSDATERSQQNLEAGSGGNFLTPEQWANKGVGHGSEYVVTNPETGEMYWLDPMKYMGAKPYYAELGLEDDRVGGVHVGMGGYETPLPENYAELEQAWNNRINSMFLNEMTTNGLDFNRAGMNLIQHGMFGDEGDTAFRQGYDSPKFFVFMDDLRNMQNQSTNYMDTSQYADWSDPGIGNPLWADTGYDPTMMYGI